jgi:hypothetical protein
VADDERYVVLIGADGGPVVSRLRAQRLQYVVKRLNSRPENWMATARLIEADAAVAVIVQLNRHNLEQMTAVDARSAYRAHADVAPRLLRAIASIPHIVLLHEDIGHGRDWVSEAPSTWMYAGDEYEETLTPETRDAAFKLFDEAGVAPTFYQRNAEAHELAALFFDDVDSNLLLRLYIPADRLYADETARLLDLFRDWLVTAERLQVRKAGYRTSRGEVVEFYADGALSTEALHAHVSGFRRFVDLLEDPEAATSALVSAGLERSRAQRFVDKNARALRRLQIDIRHEHERRLLDLRQSAEAQLMEEGDLPLALDTVGAVVDQLLSSPSERPSFGSAGQTVTITQQTFHITGSMYQINGPTATPADVVRLVGALDGGEALTTMAHELDDPETPRGRRAEAVAGIKSFLMRSRDRIEGEAFRLLMRWIESQTGI